MQVSQTKSDFDDLGLDPILLKAVQGLGYQHPTPIQKEAIPAILAGRDVIGTAQTGSGKTAAFLLPILQGLQKQTRGKSRVLVLTPTRELAAQIEQMLGDLARGTRIQGKAVYGGVGMDPQTRALRRGVDIVIATPGRLLDHMDRKNADFRGLQVLVLDEADRMFEMGFLPDVRRIVGALPRHRQTLLFSATMEREMEDLARQVCRDPFRISVSKLHRPPKSIKQTVYPVAEHLKTRLLIRMLERGDVTSALVFVRTKRRADRVAKQVGAAGFDVERIHGNRSQNQRQQALAGFKSGHHQVLVATDLAARGIDVEGISHVVNYDVPHVAIDYLHRVGRTARMEAVGEAMTLVTPDDRDKLRGIERALGKSIERVEVEGFDYRAAPPPKAKGRAGKPRPRGGGNGRGSGRGGRGGNGSGSGGHRRGRR
jgi:ATP-dependent RNA helicase RhlE